MAVSAGPFYCPENIGDTIVYTFIDNDSISGNTYVMVVADDQGNIEFTLTAGEGIAIDTDTNTVTATITAEQSSGLNNGDYYFTDLKRIEGGVIVWHTPKIILQMNAPVTP